jgi:hypothetical protein
MTLTEKLFEKSILTLVCCVIAAWVVFSVGIGARHGLRVGLATCIGVPWALFMMVRWIARRWSPPLPHCRWGMCTPRDYAWKLDPNDPHRALFQCRCGDRYELLRQPGGRERFVEIGEDGRTLPYMAHGAWRSWRLE